MTFQPVTTGIDGDINVLTGRMDKLRKEYYDAPRVIVCQRAKSITDSWKETEGDPNRLRWGKAFSRVLDESPIILRDGELIVGSETNYIRGAEVVPEVSPYDVLTSPFLWICHPQCRKRLRIERNIACGNGPDTLPG